jgi:hypothetical protein
MHRRPPQPPVPWLVLFVTALAWTGTATAQQAAQAGAQDADYVRQHYTKFEHRIPMRDGIKLFTVVYVPKDKSKTYPIILRRTPYSVAPYGLDKYPERLDAQRRRYFQEGYIVAYQDVRGRMMSEGEFVNVRPYIPNKKSPRDVDETTDTFDTVDWLVKQVPGNNGRVGISGVSYPGFYSTMGAIDAHPAVKAVSPQAPVSKWMAGDDFWHNGAFLLSHAFDFFANFGRPRPGPTSEFGARFDHKTQDGYQFFLGLGPLPNADAKYFKDEIAFWNDIEQHGKWDAFWEARDVLPHLKNIRPAMLVVGGWFDAENLYGALHTYQAIEKNNPGTTNMLVMGPWSHGQWSADDGGGRLGDIAWGSKTGDYYTEHVEVPFFNQHLKQQGQASLAEATVFETGANEWRRMEAWPPKEASARDVYLRADGTLTFAPAAPGDGGPSFREFVSDPAHPVPYTAEVRHWYNASFMVEDQRFASRRPDVLVFQTEPLTEDLRVAGPITATLFVSTTGTDSDWVVKVIDVFPDDTKNPEPNPGNAQLGGYQMLVRGDVLRGKFRNSLAAPEPFQPGAVTKIEFDLQDVFHRFKKGHRLMVQVQSTWFPKIDVNPQTFVDIYAATEKDFQKATQRVYSGGEQASRVRLRILKDGA